VIGSVGGYWRRHFLGAELASTALLTLIFAVWVEAFHGDQTVQRLIAGQRTAVYGSLAAIDGALLGFITTTTAIVLGFAQDDRFTVLRESTHYPTLWRTFTSTIRFLGLATVAALVALVIDRDGTPQWPTMIACSGTAVIAGLRVGRSVWILEHVIKVITRPDPRTTEHPGAHSDAR
jgi:hypothetical protein